MNFKGKTAVITGGANGIGLCITERLRMAGARVAVIDLDAKGCDCDYFFCGDIACENTLALFTKEVAERFQQIDFLINNACVNNRGILSGCNYEDFVTVQKVGIAAPYMLTKLFMPYFSPSASIVNIC